MSINNDIRVRTNRSGRFLMLILGLAALALTASFAISLVPSTASAANLPNWFHWNNWHPHHNFHNYGNDNSDQNDQLYTQCHNHDNDDNVNGIDLKDPACNGAENDAPVAADQSLSTNEGVALSGITLGATDADDDLLYFTVTTPSNGSVSVASTAFTQTSLPQVTYTPNAGFTGTDSFHYVVNDGRIADNATGTITIVVNPVCGDNQTLNTDTHECENNAPTAPECTGATTFDTFTLGSVNGQGGWQITGAYDQAIVSNTYGFPTFGCQTLRLSDSVTSGSFGDWIFTPSTTNEAGETAAVSGGLSGGTRQNHFEAQFDIASAVPGAQQPGMHASVSPDRGDGARMSYLRFEDQADGLHVFFDDVPGGQASIGTDNEFTETDIATLARTAPHTIKFSIDFADGAGNDIVKIYIDGTLKTTGTTWEDYYRFDPEQAGSGNQVPTVDSLIIQARGDATPADAGKGFLFDNFSISTGATPIVDPTCSENQHLDNHACVANQDNGGSNGGNGGGNGGGGNIIGNGPLSIGFVNNGGGNGGQVLGASTEAPMCSAYLSAYLKKGMKGAAVTKLQQFLNSHEGAKLAVNGTFDQATFDAVSAFQTKYSDEVLKPWFTKGLSKDMNPSGYVYKTTLYKINLLECASLNTPAPQLP